MMAILFVASTGFSVFTHICIMSGDEEVSVQEIDSCCKMNEEPADVTIESDCCSGNSHFYKLDFTGIKERFQPPPQSVVIAFYSQIISFKESLPGNTILTYNDLQPPKTGRDILSYKQVFRI